MSIRYVTFLLNSKILITRQLNIIRTRYLTHLFVSITSRNVQNFNFSTLTLTLTLTSLDRPLAILALNYTSLGLQGDPKKSIRVWLSISQQLFVKYKRNVLHQRNEKLT